MAGAMLKPALKGASKVGLHSTVAPLLSGLTHRLLRRTVLLTTDAVANNR